MYLQELGTPQKWKDLDVFGHIVCLLIYPI